MLISLCIESVTNESIFIFSYKKLEEHNVIFLGYGITIVKLFKNSFDRNKTLMILLVGIITHVVLAFISIDL
jgi:uncharacterized membrane-anchored protein YitT (DUF2179 family)